MSRYFKTKLPLLNKNLFQQNFSESNKQVQQICNQLILYTQLLGCQNFVVEELGFKGDLYDRKNNQLKNFTEKLEEFKYSTQPELNSPGFICQQITIALISYDNLFSNNCFGFADPIGIPFDFKKLLCPKLTGYSSGMLKQFCDTFVGQSQTQNMSEPILLKNLLQSDFDDYALRKRVNINFVEKKKWYDHKSSYYQHISLVEKESFVHEIEMSTDYVNEIKDLFKVQEEQIINKEEKSIEKIIEEEKVEIISDTDQFNTELEKIFKLKDTGNKLCKQKQFKQALEIYQKSEEQMKSLKLQSSDNLKQTNKDKFYELHNALLNNQGYIYYKIKKYDRALEFCTQFHETSKSVQSSIPFIQIYEKTNNNEKAFVFIEKGMSLLRKEKKSNKFIENKYFSYNLNKFFSKDKDISFDELVDQLEFIEHNSLPTFPKGFDDNKWIAFWRWPFLQDIELKMIYANVFGHCLIIQTNDQCGVREFNNLTESLAKLSDEHFFINGADTLFDYLKQQKSRLKNKFPYNELLKPDMKKMKKKRQKIKKEIKNKQVKKQLLNVLQKIPEEQQKQQESFEMEEFPLEEDIDRWPIDIKYDLIQDKMVNYQYIICIDKRIPNYLFLSIKQFEKISNEAWLNNYKSFRYYSSLYDNIAANQLNDIDRILVGMNPVAQRHDLQRRMSGSDANDRRREEQRRNQQRKLKTTIDESYKLGENILKQKQKYLDDWKSLHSDLLSQYFKYQQQIFEFLTLSKEDKYEDDIVIDLNKSIKSNDKVSNETWRLLKSFGINLNFIEKQVQITIEDFALLPFDKQEEILIDYLSDVESKRNKTILDIYSKENIERKNYFKKLSTEQIKQLPIKLRIQAENLNTISTKEKENDFNKLFQLSQLSCKRTIFFNMASQENNTISDNQLEDLLEYIYFDSKVFDNFPAEYIKIKCMNDSTRCKLLNSLLVLLSFNNLQEFKVQQDKETFPYSFDKHKMCKDNSGFDELFYQISLRILIVIKSLLPQHYQFFLQNKKLETVPSLQPLIKLKGEEFLNSLKTPFLFLIELLGTTNIKQSVHHTKLILEILNLVVEGNVEYYKGKTDEKLECTIELNLKQLKSFFTFLYQNSNHLNEGINGNLFGTYANTLGYLLLNTKNKDLFIEEIGNQIEELSVRINQKLENQKKRMKKVYKIIFNQNNISKEQMLHPSEKEKRILDKHISIFEEQLVIKEDDLFSFYKIFLTIWNLFEHSKCFILSNFSSNKQAVFSVYSIKQAIKSEIQEIFHKEELQELWLTSSEILSIINDLFPSNFNKVYQLIEQLQPIVESFFVLYSILYSEEEIKFNKDEQFFSITRSFVDTKEISLEIKRAISLPVPILSKLQSMDPEEKLPVMQLKRSFTQIREDENQTQETLLQIFCQKQKAILNVIIDQKPQLLENCFKFIIEEKAQVLNFECKIQYFYDQLAGLYKKSTESFNPQVRRDNVFADTYNYMKLMTTEEILGKTKVKFIGEQGQDEGGLTKEWYQILTSKIMDPQFGLFLPNYLGNVYQPNADSFVNPYHLKYFEFFGKVVGRAITTKNNVNAYFTRSFYKHIIEAPLTYHDFADIDEAYYKSLDWIYNANDTKLPEMFFAIDARKPYSQETYIKDLKPNGRNIQLTHKNRHEYVKLYCSQRLIKDIQQQTEAFLKGLYEIIPKKLLKIFDSRQLELLISGLPDVDVEDLKKNTKYKNCHQETQCVKWLFQILKQYSKEQRASFLQFVCGSSKVPVGGFKNLKGGIFKITLKSGDPNAFPMAHTCFNELDLPSYSSKEALRVKIDFCITHAKEGYGNN